MKFRFRKIISFRVTVAALFCWRADAASTITTIAGGGGDVKSATSIACAPTGGITINNSGHLVYSMGNDFQGNAIWRVDDAGIARRIAGNEGPGNSPDGIPATVANLHKPLQMVSDDATGVIFFADSINSAIKQIDGSNILTTKATFGNNLPESLARDAAGNLYVVVSSKRYQIIKVATDGGQSIVAGITTSGVSTGDGGQATAAQLGSVNGLAVDSMGNLYLSDTDNNCIRMVALSGTITTVAGGGTNTNDNIPATSALLARPRSVAVSPNDTLYIADTNGHRIRKVVSGIITTIAGSGIPGFTGDNGAATAASINSPDLLAFDSLGNLFFADAGNNRIRRVAKADGTITTVAGNGLTYSAEGAAGTDCQFSNLSDATVSPDGGIIIADRLNNVLRRLFNGHVTLFAGGGDSFGENISATATTIDDPDGVVADDNGNVYVALYGENRVRKISSSGIITTVAGTGAVGFGGDGGDATLAQLWAPMGLALGQDNSIFIADSNNSRIRKIASDGTISTVAGTTFSGFFGDNGLATNAALFQPTSMDVDAAGNLWIADYFNDRIRYVSVSNGVITTVAGGGTDASEGILATAAFLNHPYGVRVDAAGNIYISEANGQRVRMVRKSDGKIFTVVGAGQFGFSGDGGLPTAALLRDLGNITLSGSDLLISDAGNHRLRRVTNIVPAGAPSITSVTPNHGFTVGGTGIVIIGTAFQHGATVLIDGNPATNVVLVSPTEINAAVPPGTAGPKNVVIENPDAQTFIFSNGFTYVEQLHVTSIAPNSGSVAGGTDITITGAGFQSGATVKIDGVAATNAVFVNSTQLRATTPAGTAGSKNVVVTNPDAPAFIVINGFTYTFGPPPTVTLSSLQDGQTLAEPATVILHVEMNADAGIQQALIFNGTELVESQSISTFDYRAADLPAGVYIYTAKVTDNNGVTTTSNPIIVIVIANTPPIPLSPPPSPAPALTTSITIGRPDEGKPIVVRTALDHAAHVEATVYNRRGVKVKKVIDEDMPAGVASITWDGRDDDGTIVEPGVYVVLVQVDGSVQQKEKVVIIRE